jgi:hypothetical protein
VQVLDAERRGGDFCFGKSLVSDHAPLALVHATSGVDDGRPKRRMPRRHERRASSKRDALLRLKSSATEVTSRRERATRHGTKRATAALAAAFAVPGKLCVERRSSLRVT